MADFVRLVAIVLLFAAAAQAPAADSPRHVVVVVWDGMRPDFVTEKQTPTLWRFRNEGVWFANHHSVFTTATNVNGAAIATGVYPARNGVVANREYRPAVRELAPFDTAEPEMVKRADEISGGKYLRVATIAERLQAAGKRTAVAGSKSIALLQDRKAEWTMAMRDPAAAAFMAAPMPDAVRTDTLRLLGPFQVESNDVKRNQYATRALTEVLWRDGVPDFSLLWLSQPDLSQHGTAPGSPDSLAAIKSSDDNLATVLQALEKKNARKDTDVFVVSDHGFSTITRAVDIPALLRADGFDAVTKFKEPPRPGQVMVVGNAGSSLFYVIDHDPAVVARLVEWLQRSDFAAVIFTREQREGTFALDAVHANTPDAPDVIVAMRWGEKPSRFGIPGELMADAAREAGKGTHASLSKFDVHNLLVAAGPSFKPGAVSELPSGNIDVAPTVLAILGVRAEEKFDGRVLAEAMAKPTEAPRAQANTIEAARAFENGEWKQYLRTSRVGATIYFDEGNGGFEPR